MRRLGEVVDQLEDWFALRNSVELDDFCLEVGWLYQLKFHITLTSQENVLVKKSQFSVLTFAGGSLEEAGACLAEKEEDKSTSSPSS